LKHVEPLRQKNAGKNNASLPSIGASVLSVYLSILVRLQRIFLLALRRSPRERG